MANEADNQARTETRVNLGTAQAVAAKAISLQKQADDLLVAIAERALYGQVDAATRAKWLAADPVLPVLRSLYDALQPLFAEGGR